MPTYSISGKALAGSTMTLSGAATATTTAGPTGLYSFASLVAGAYVITPSKTGIKFTPASSNQTITAANITGVNFLGTSVGTQGSTETVQRVVDRVMGLADVEPTLTVGGFSEEPALTIASDVMNEICATAFPHKWNETTLPQFYTNSYQQDYALVNPDGSSVYNVEWLERGIAFDINSTSIPKAWVDIECGRSIPQRTGTFSSSGGSMLGNPGFIAVTFPNASMYYGVWGDADLGNPTLGNNPVPGSVYANPLGATISAASWAAGQALFTVNYVPNGITGGSTIVITGITPTGYNGSWAVVSVDYSAPTAPVITVTMVSNPGTYEAGGIINNSAATSQPVNPITQIIDSNGNLLVLTTYGTEGTTAPTAAIGAIPGTTCAGAGATTVWTVVDPVGTGVRILQVPSKTGVVWQMNITAQMPPVKFTSLGQLLFPLPDKYEPFFRAGFIAQSYRYSPIKKIHDKFKEEWQLWIRSLNNMRAAEDRELEEYSFTLDKSIMSRGTTRNKWEGPAWPFRNPRL